VELRGRDDIDGSEPEPRLYDGRIEDCDFDRYEHLRFEYGKPDGDGRRRALGIIHLQSRLSDDQPGGTVHGHLDRQSDLLVVELRGRDDIDDPESEPRLYDGRIEDCDFDRHQ
jgi:hypothetical protein